MKRINDKKLLESYIEKFNIDDLFSENMRKHMNLVLWNKNEFICREGEELNNLYFLVEGKTKVCKNMANGKCLLICFDRPLRIIGEVEFMRSNTADCTVQTIEDTYGIEMSFQVVQSKLFNDCKFLLNMCRYLSEKLIVTSTNNSINILYSLENKLASYIYAFVEKEKVNYEFEFEGTYNEIAELLGTSYRHLNRTLNKFCDEGILEKKSKVYIIRNLKKLEMLSGDLYK